ncbi:transcriptional regulator [Streptomyces sp. CC53]|uniref:helix-turn-helix domain-containing protein n=1 Tax=Streptomyces sp. CC53 TaxID=1906740 RepID=UPI0008DE03DE|nr:helix-turn-helix transcriptional regulator [Streptomyces sp. CC53]OII63279.1 transcriptional regulator [Streptomyces sp. CC53]
MPADPMYEVGRRIAVARRARRLSQPELAAAANVSLSMLRKIEQGSRAPGDATLDAIATALGLDPSQLLTDQTRTDGRVRAALPALSAAIAAYDIPMEAPRRELAELEQAASEAEAWRLNAQYVNLAQAAPTLVADAAAALHAATAGQRTRAARVLVSASRSGDAVAYKFGARDLSARLIDVMRWAAPQTDDPVVSAATAYVRTETFFSARAHEAGLRALEHAIDQAPRPTTEQATAARGALCMRAAVIAGRAGDADAATEHLHEAEQLATRVREGVFGGTAFGPDSVRIHRASVAVSLGGDHAADALNLAREWQPPADLPAERLSGFYIELARAQLWCGQMGPAFESLKVARRFAPQHTREHPWARETAATLRRLRRADTESLASFAEWIGAV